MDCEEFKKVSAGYFDDAAPPELQPAIVEHLEQCPACAEIVQQVKTLRAGIRLALSKECCPANLRDRIRRKLRTSEGKTTFRKLSTTHG